MRAFLVFLLFCAFALTARWYYVCKIKNLCGEPVTEVPQDIRKNNLELRDGEEVILQGYDQFRFDSAQVKPAMNANNRDFLDKLANHFQTNKDKNLTITGVYRPNEAGIASGMFENLGVARADEIREMLVKRGIAQERITLDFKQAATNNLDEPLLFTSFTPAEEEDTEEYDKVAFTFEDMTFSEANFEYNSAEFKPQEQFLLYADSVKNVLELYPDKLLIITGHTDSIGGDVYNEDLGLRRAASAKEYFKEMGITSDIEVATKGRTKPMATNSTEEGRQKNRRVNFKIEDPEQIEEN